MKRSNAISFAISSKRKLPLHGIKSKYFSTEEDDSENNCELSFVTSNSCIALEDTWTVCKRLKFEGNTLAENSRFWEALAKFNKAIDLLLDKVKGHSGSMDNMNLASGPSFVLLSVLHELCSQCYTELGEVYPAVEFAEKAVNFNKLCHIARRTLSRAQINIGELYLAKENIQLSLRLNPSCLDSWDDLNNILSLTERLQSTNWTNLPVKTRPGIVCQR